MPSLTSCFVQFLVAVFFQPTSETSPLLCLAESARLPLDGSSYHVFSWCRSQDSGVARNFPTGGASICSILFCPFPFSCPTKSAVQSKNSHQITYQKIMYFHDGRCVRPLRHLYGYATESRSCCTQTV